LVHDVSHRTHDLAVARLPKPSNTNRPSVEYSVAARRRGDVREVALGVGERPPGGRILVGDEAATGRDCGGDPRLRLVGWHPDVEVDPVDLPVVRADLLEPDGCPATERVDEVLRTVI